MSRIHHLCAALALTGLGLTGCDDVTDDFGYAQRRGINADIAATHEIGPTSLYPGQNFSDQSEPKGTYPWQLDERH